VAEVTLVAVHHVIPLALIERARRLPVKGTVRVRVGQQVSASDTVASASWSKDHAFIDVASTLGISAAAADSVLRFKAGDNVPAGAILAKSRGLLPRTVRAPRAGRVVAAGGGQVLLESGESRLELRAGISGVVREVEPDRGVVIQTVGALVQGVWGNGRIDSGVMINLADNPDTLLTPPRMDVSMRGYILVGGQVHDADVLRTAAEIAVRGLLIGGIFPSLLSLAREMRYPIVVTDGFGAVPMNSAAHRLISTNSKREATLNAEALDRYTGAHPEVIIPLPGSTAQPLREVAQASAGQTVRLRREPHPGAIGTIVRLPAGSSTYPSGLSAPGAEVRLQNGEQVLIPLVNLEVVG
jgi:hypothetical protein